MKDQDITWASLHERGQQNLEDFLNIELDLVVTFSGMAKVQHNTKRQKELQRKALEALHTVQHLSMRIDDLSIRNAILDRAKDLGRRVQEPGE